MGSFLSALKLFVAARLNTALNCSRCWSMGVWNGGVQCLSSSCANASIASCDESLMGENLCLIHLGGGDAPEIAAEKVAMVGK